MDNKLTYETISSLTTYDPTAAGFFGPVIEKNGRYYITTLKEGMDVMDVYRNQDREDYDINDYYGVTAVIDKSCGINGATNVVKNLRSTDLKFSQKSYDIDTVDSFIKEVEHATGSEVGPLVFKDESVTIFNPNNTNEVMLTTTMNEVSDENGNKVFDVSKIANELGVNKNRVSVDAKLDDNNISILANQIANVYPDSKIKISKDSNGEYKIEIKSNDDDEKNIDEIILNENMTIAEAVSLINKRYSSKGKSFSGFSPSLETERTTRKMGQQYKIHIDVLSFENAMDKQKNAKEKLNSEIGEFRPEKTLTDKLLAAYKAIAGAGGNIDINAKLQKARGMLDNVVTNVHYSLQAYQNIDHNLGLIIASVINEIFSMNIFADKETEDFYSMPLEEREKTLDQMINDVNDRISKLESDFEKKYPGGNIYFSEEVNNLLLGIGYGFGFVNGTDEVLGIKNGEVGGKAGFTGLKLLEILDFAQENDAFSKMKSYAEGLDWYDSGMSDLFAKSPGGASGSWGTESIFLHNFNAAFDISILEKSDPRSSDDRKAFFRDNYLRTLPELLDKKTNITDTDTGEVKNVSVFDAMKYYVNDYIIDQEAIAGAKHTRDNYEHYRKLMPFDADMQGQVYLEYLTRDWNDIDYGLYSDLMGKKEYLSQKELALYMMYKGANLPGITNNNIDEDRAAAYLEAMDDLINQRKGLEEAALRIKYYNDLLKTKNPPESLWAYIKSDLQGFSDGVEGFLAGLGNIFLSDGKKSSSDYRNMYMISLLNENNLFTSDLTDVERSLLKANYSISKSVGSAIIPTLVSFTPGVGPIAGTTLSTILAMGSSFGNSTEYAKQSGAGSESYLYGCLSAFSTGALNRFLSGIAGLNGNTSLPSGWQEYLKAAGKSAIHGYTGVYLDAGLRSAILGEPIDLSRLSSDAFENAIYGAVTACAMNRISKCAIKLADGLILELQPGKYRNYNEYLADCKKQFYESPLGQKLLSVRNIFSGTNKNREQLDRNLSPTVLKWLKEYKDDPSKDPMIDLSDKAGEWGITLKGDQKLVYDPNTKSYNIASLDNSGNFDLLIVPQGIIPNYEGSVNIDTYYEFKKLMGDKIKSATFNPNGMVKIITKYGEEYNVPSDKKTLFSQNVMYEIERMNSEYEANLRYNYYSENYDEFDPSKLKFSQNSVNDSVDLITSMSLNGWDGVPIDVVRIVDSDGNIHYVTVDNTRVAAAQKVGINVFANVHDGEEILPAKYTDPQFPRFFWGSEHHVKRIAQTWQEAIEARIARQNSAFRHDNPYGSYDLPVMK